MEKARIILWILVGLTSFGGVARMFMGGDGGGNPAAIIMQKQLERDFKSAETGIECGYSNAGITFIPPTRAVQGYLDLQKASVGETERLYDQPQAFDLPPLPHIIGRPGRPWTIVLEPNDEQKNIQLLGFGEEPNTPLLQREILCE